MRQVLVFLNFIVFFNSSLAVGCQQYIAVSANDRGGQNKVVVMNTSTGNVLKRHDVNWRGSSTEGNYSIGQRQAEADYSSNSSSCGRYSLVAVSGGYAVVDTKNGNVSFHKL